ncbi:MAG TPA: class I SAM-dependent methyltransferase [Candidatus Binatia bacterium]|nr:class I SAM-dependent methyltransferase [Candidatus Binatia bacterium]
MPDLKELYSKRAKHYDLTSNLYYFIGVRVGKFRKEAVQAIKLQRGSRVLDLACGTGLNFPYLEEAVGPEGRIIGVDMTPSMLVQARRRVDREGWRNVELIESDAAHIALEQSVDGVLCTFAISLVPDYPAAIRNFAALLSVGGRMVFLDVKSAEGALSFLNPLAVFLTRPFGGTNDVLAQKPWLEMQKCLADVEVTQHYAGLIYIASGARPQQPAVS